MIVRITRAKVGHCQAPLHSKKPTSRGLFALLRLPDHRLLSVRPAAAPGAASRPRSLTFAQRSVKRNVNAAANAQVGHWKAPECNSPPRVGFLLCYACLTITYF